MVHDILLRADKLGHCFVYSNMRLNDTGRNNPRYATLQSKWRTVSRMAIERKKKLQDAYDMLQEVGSQENFQFFF